MSTLAGSTNNGNSDGSGTNAIFDIPTGVAVDFGSGDIYIADYANNNIRKISLFGGNVFCDF